MKKPVPVESASAFIDEKIKELGDWRGKTLAKVREIIHEADPEIVEEWKWRGDSRLVPRRHRRSASGSYRRLQRGIRPGLAAKRKATRRYPHHRFPTDPISR